MISRPSSLVTAEILPSFSLLLQRLQYRQQLPRWSIADGACEPIGSGLASLRTPRPPASQPRSRAVPFGALSTQERLPRGARSNFAKSITATREIAPCKQLRSRFCAWQVLQAQDFALQDPNPAGEYVGGVVNVHLPFYRQRCGFALRQPTASAEERSSFACGSWPVALVTCGDADGRHRPFENARAEDLRLVRPLPIGKIYDLNRASPLAGPGFKSPLPSAISGKMLTDNGPLVSQCGELFFGRSHEPTTPEIEAPHA